MAIRIRFKRGKRVVTVHDRARAWLDDRGRVVRWADVATERERDAVQAWLTSRHDDPPAAPWPIDLRETYRAPHPQVVIGVGVATDPGPRSGFEAFTGVYADGTPVM